MEKASEKREKRTPRRSGKRSKKGKPFPRRWPSGFRSHWQSALCSPWGDRGRLFPPWLCGLEEAPRGRRPSSLSANWLPSRAEFDPALCSLCAHSQMPPALERKSPSLLPLHLGSEDLLGGEERFQSTLLHTTPFACFYSILQEPREGNTTLHLIDERGFTNRDDTQAWDVVRR